MTPGNFDIDHDVDLVDFHLDIGRVDVDLDVDLAYAELVDILFESFLVARAPEVR